MIFEEVLKHAEEKNLHKIGDDFIFRRFVFSQTFGRFSDRIDFNRPVSLMIKRICWIIYQDRLFSMSNATWEDHLERKNGNRKNT
jgi:hypothetical protein